MHEPSSAPPPPALAASDRRIAARVERILGRYAENPMPFFYGPLTVVTLGVLGFGLSSIRERAEVAGIALLTAVWFALWLRCRRRQDTPTGRRVFRLMAFVGAPLMGVLVLHNFFFTLVIVPLFARYFVEMPLAWSYPAGLLMLVPIDLAFRDVARSADPAGGMSLMMLIVRAVVMLLIGIMFMTLRTQRDEKQRLLGELTESQRKAGMLEERQRLAREIHDTLAQGFAAILAHLETADLGRGNGDAGESKAQHVASARRVARESLEEARRMMAALRPELLEAADLPAAMSRIAEAWSERTGLPCVLSVTGSPTALHRDIEVALLRTAQEALANVWKHARSTRVSLTLSYMGDVVVLDVQDDGVGGAGSGGLGFGLRSMRERMEQIGGTFTVESAPGEGTTISASAPGVSTTAEMRIPSMGSPLT
jgi:signal transduction histidine kinase